MELKKFVVIIQVLLIFVANSNAQTILLDEFNTPMDHARVKFLDEFFARFNGKEKGIGINGQFFDRATNVLFLFDKFQFKSQTDSLFIEAKNFSEKVMQDSVYISYTDSCWYAKAKCHGKLAGKGVDFFLYLFVEERGEYMYKWVIADVEGEIFNTSRSRKHNELFIMPNDHEQSFMSLKRVTNETSRYIDDFAKDGYVAEPLSVFLTLVRCGQLKIDYVSDVEFFFLQVPNYCFSVKYFERNDINLGWLINTFTKCSVLDKVNILSSLRRVYNKKDEVAKEQAVELTKEVNSEDSVSLIINDSCRFEMNHSTAESVVWRFCSILELWWETGDRYYQKKATAECAGRKGRECVVSDSLMFQLAKSNYLPLDSSYKLRDFWAGLEIIQKKKNINIKFDNIKQIASDNDSYIVSCIISLCGDMNFRFEDLFYVRRKDRKIFCIKSLDNNI